MAYQIQVRRDTSANWTAKDPILAQGEIGYETDTGKAKIGDGSTAWTPLAYFPPGTQGTVTNVTSTNTAISVATGTTTPALTLATLDVIAADGPPAANWSNNSHKITSVLDPTLPQDAATKNYVDTHFSSPLTTKGDIYGFNTANARIPVGSDGAVLTADSTQALGLKWASPVTGMVLLFDQALSGSAASIDSGAGGFSTSYATLFIYATVRTTFAAVSAGAYIQFNNDTGLNYTRQYLNAAGGAVSSGTTNSSSPANASTFTALGANAATNNAATASIVVPSYSGTTFNKAYTINSSATDPSSSATTQTGVVWASTSAITRVALLANGGANLAAGSRLTVYGA